MVKRRYGTPQRAFIVVALFLISVFPLARASSAQEQAGIIGVVTDDSGGVLPGVTVTASSPALQVKTVTDVTNDRGEYRLSPLPIGTYEVEYALAGFQSVRHQDVRLTVGFVAKLDVQLKVGAIAESVTVSGAAPVVDVAATTVSTRLTNETLELLPSSRNGLQALMSQAPGARTNLDVGGSTFTAVPIFHAFGQDGNAWTLLDGVAMMTPKRRSAGGTPRWDYDTIEEAQVQSLAKEADVPTKGIQVNAVIKSGGNDFHGRTAYSDTGDKFEGDNLDDALRAQGISSTGGIQRRYDVGGDLGGRLVRDKLWFYVESRRTSQVARTVECFKPDGTACSNLQLQKLFTEKLSYQINPSNRISHFYHYGVFITTSNGSRLVSYESRTRRHVLGTIGKVDWQRIKGNLVTSVLFGFWTWHGQTAGFASTPSRLDLVTRVVTGGGNGAGMGQPEYRYGPRVSVSWYKPGLFMGNHAFKAGVEWLHGRADATFNIGPKAVRPNPNYQLQFRNGVPTQILIPNYPVNPYSHADNLPVYLHDSWTVGRRLTLGLGIRYEHSEGYLPAQCRDAALPPGDVAFPAACYPLIQVKNWNSVVPRFHAAYDLTGDGRTVLKGGWGRYAQIRYVEDPQQFQQNGPAESTFRWRDLNGNNDYDPGEVNLNPNGPDFLATTSQGQSLSAALTKVVQNPNEKQPTSDEYSVSLEREVMANFAVRATGVYSRNINNYRIQNDLRPYSAYNIPITNADPGPDGRVGTTDDPGSFITYYDFPAAYAGASFLQRMSVNDRASDQWFKSFEVAGSKRLSNRWQMLASFSSTWKHIPWVQMLGENASNAVDFTEINPNVEINTGDYTKEWLGRISGSYNFPMDVLVSARYEHRSGTPYARTALLTGGQQIPSITVNVEPIGARTLPNISLLDLTVQKAFSLAASRRLNLRLNIYNALNNNVVTALTAQSGANFGKATTILLPRIFDVGASFQF
jgi:hypothetical protein